MKNFYFNIKNALFLNWNCISYFDLQYSVNGKEGSKYFTGLTEYSGTMHMIFLIFNCFIFFLYFQNSKGGCRTPPHPQSANGLSIIDLVLICLSICLVRRMWR